MQDAGVLTQATPPIAQRTTRIESIDIVRGAVMVLMALDHVRDYVTNVRFQPENLAQSSTALFFTRWVTHFCAPTFFLLAGIGIGIAFNRGKQPGELSKYLLTRGLWLLFLELIVTPIGWRFDYNILPAFALVLWALGWSMIVMALAIHLPRAIVAAVSLIMIFGHNLLDGVTPASFGSLSGLWNFLHVPGFVIPNVLLVGYPLIPWVGVMGIGFVLAATYEWDARRRRTLLIQVGAAATVLFLVVRGMNGYGNPDAWSVQRTTGLTISSFLNVRKYPPSLDFLLMTLGPALIVLAFAESARGRFAGWLRVYGRVPLFFYVTHIFVGHLAGVILAYVQSGEVMRIPIITAYESIPSWYGLTLPGVYAVWLLVVLSLYYPCRWFARMKDTRRDWWLSYL